MEASWAPLGPSWKPLELEFNIKLEKIAKNLIKPTFFSIFGDVLGASWVVLGRLGIVLGAS